jgi:hypothetical protein
MRPTHVSAASRIYLLPSNGDSTSHVTYPYVYSDPYIMVKLSTDAATVHYLIMHNVGTPFDPMHYEIYALVHVSHV